MKKTAPQKEKASALVTANHFKAIIPKPNKTEIIEALTKIKVEELTAETRAAVERRDALAEECKQLIIDWHRIHPAAKPSVDLGQAGCEWNARKREYVSTEKPTGVEILFGLSDLSDEINRKLMEYYEAKRLADRRFTPDGIRKQIKAGLVASKEERVDALLADPESRKALEEALAKIAA